MFETSSEVSALAVSTSTRKSSSGSATYGPHVRLCLLHQKSISSFEVSVSEVVACFSSAFEKRVRRLREYIFLVKKKRTGLQCVGIWTCRFETMHKWQCALFYNGCCASLCLRACLHLWFVLLSSASCGIRFYSNDILKFGFIGRFTRALRASISKCFIDNFVFVLSFLIFLLKRFIEAPSVGTCTFCPWCSEIGTTDRWTVFLCTCSFSGQWLLAWYPKCTCNFTSTSSCLWRNECKSEHRVQTRHVASRKLGQFRLLSASESDRISSKRDFAGKD